MPVEIKSYREPVEVTFTFPSPSPEEKANHKANPRKFPLPPDLQQETGHISVTLRELLPSAEAKAFNRVGRDAGLMIQELVKESLVRAVKVGGEVVELSTEDSSVDAFMAMKWSAMDEDVPKPYKNNEQFVNAIPRPHEETVEMVKDYCQYVWDTYGRFPAYLDPMYQRLTCQAQHVDPDFYEENFPEGSLSGQHKNHFHRWHPELCDHEGKPPRKA